MHKTLHIILFLLGITMLGGCSVGNDDESMLGDWQSVTTDAGALTFKGQWWFGSYSSTIFSYDKSTFSLEVEGSFNAQTHMLTVKQMPAELFLLMCGIENPSNVKASSYSTPCSETAYSANSIVYNSESPADYEFYHDGHTVVVKFRKLEVALNNYAHTITIGMEVTDVNIDGEKKNTIFGVLFTEAQMIN